MPGLTDWTPTRAAALERLAAFLPHAGADYARLRNIDQGPDDRSNVSALSPWIRRRILTEEEVIAAVLRRHGFARAEKFIQEVCWRTYWKGWLELRPGVLADYHAAAAALSAEWADSAALAAARAGQTGIACFDAWAAELVRTGWLHNHARMWFASIWIFTLRLPWELGAAFMAQHLLDADPASNTLSWRWVAGLQTPGKHYLARAENIRLNTLKRFDPAGQLDEQALPVPMVAPNPPPGAIPPAQVPATDRVALLLTEEDLSPETLPVGATVVALAALTTPSADSPAGRFAAGAVADGLDRAGAQFGLAGQLLAPEAVAAWALDAGVSEVVTACAPLGPSAPVLDEIERALALVSIRLVRVRRAWDTQCWPLATRGFFAFRQHIPKLVAGLV
ncbi:FAD-binding domain-containing protein [Novosphingobium arvoryzae]|uniref:FAD-binding domain-containing protein n=1 Tax=Novosphingobium arvoryzae TaxID=1256514 RepID=UPI0035B2DCB5